MRGTVTRVTGSGAYVIVDGQPGAETGPLLALSTVTAGDRVLLVDEGQGQRTVIGAFGRDLGITDHGSLTGLADDDHAQYVRADGTRHFTARPTIRANGGSGAGLWLANSSGTSTTFMGATGTGSGADLGLWVAGAWRLVASQTAVGAKNIPFAFQRSDDTFGGILYGGTLAGWDGPDGNLYANPKFSAPFPTATDACPGWDWFWSSNITATLVTDASAFTSTHAANPAASGFSMGRFLRVTYSASNGFIRLYTSGERPVVPGEAYRLRMVYRVRGTGSVRPILGYWHSRVRNGAIAFGDGATAVDAGVGSAYTAVQISTVARASNVATVTTTGNHGYTSGDVVKVECSDATYDTDRATITVTGATTFTYANTGTDSGSTARTGQTSVWLEHTAVFVVPAGKRWIRPYHVLDSASATTVVGEIGYLSLERWTGRAFAAAVKTSNESRTAGQVIAFSQDFNDPDGLWDTTNSRFTAPVTGHYEVHVTLLVPAGYTGDFRIYKNGGDTGIAGYSGAVQTAEAYQQANAHTIIAMNAGDYIDIRSTSAATYYGSATVYHSHIAISQVG